MRPRYLTAGLMLLLMWTAIGYASAASDASGQASRLWRLAENEQATLEARGVVLHDAPLSSYIMDVAGRLWKQVSSDLDSPTIRIFMDTGIEAYAFPNGHCFLSTGMLELIENESQLAMILSHEIVHYARQHTASLYNHFQKTTLPIDRQDAGRNSMAGRRTIQKQIDAAEHQADSEGLSILKAAGYCEAEVLPLMCNLTKRMQDRGHSETVGQLEKRAAFFKLRVGKDRKRHPGPMSAETDREGYLDRIAPALMANAQIALRRGEWDQADRSICKFLDSRPEDARAHYLKGEMLRRQNSNANDNPCIGSYQKALNIDPTFPLAHRALGEWYYKAGRYQMAKPYFEAFLSLAPEDKAREYIKGYLRQCQN
jgi:predicted Zn-dependent protease